MISVKISRGSGKEMVVGLKKKNMIMTKIVKLRMSEFSRGEQRARRESVLLNIGP